MGLVHRGYVAFGGSAASLANESAGPLATDRHRDATPYIAFGYDAKTPLTESGRSALARTVGRRIAEPPQGAGAPGRPGGAGTAPGAPRGGPGAVLGRAR